MPLPAVWWPDYTLAETILYEVHVRGFTAAHPGVPPALRGTYAGLAHEAALEHLVNLGVSRRWSCCRCITSCQSSFCLSGD